MRSKSVHGRLERPSLIPIAEDQELFGAIVCGKVAKWLLHVTVGHRKRFQNAEFAGSGGGTRTPDTRIMIPQPGDRRDLTGVFRPLLP
jgi:hypothetical protein